MTEGELADAERSLIVAWDLLGRKGPEVVAEARRLQRENAGLQAALDLAHAARDIGLARASRAEAAEAKRGTALAYLADALVGEGHLYDWRGTTDLHEFIAEARE